MSLSNMSNDERDHAVEIMNIKLGYEERLKKQRAAHKEEMESLGRTIDALWGLVSKKTQEVQVLTRLANKATMTTKKSVLNSMRLLKKYSNLKKDHSKKRSEIEMLTETIKKRARLNMTSGTDDDSDDDEDARDDDNHGQRRHAHEIRLPRFDAKKEQRF